MLWLMIAAMLLIYFVPGLVTVLPRMMVGN